MNLGTMQKDMPLFLAPMAGYTDMSFRTLCKAHGSDVSVTEMISAKGLFMGSKKTAELLETAEEERPVIVQIFGHEPDIMADMAKRIRDRMGDAMFALDINMGCPAPKITGNGEGSALMRDPILVGQIVEAVAKAIPLPVTVKIRKGFDAEHCNAPEIARIAEESGAAAITVHGRTREQMYSGTADYQAIAAVREAIRIPLIGNGDVTDAKSALRMIKETGCDGIMIGRGALGNPWVFEEIRAALNGEAYVPPDQRTRIETAIRHAEMTVAHKGQQGVLELRKHIIWYLRGVRGASQLRTKLQSAQNIEEMAQILLDTCENDAYNGKACLHARE